MAKIVPVVQQREAPKITQCVNVKLVQGERVFLDDLVGKQLYPTRSAALRAGLGMLMEKHKHDPELDQMIERQRQRHRPRQGASAFPRVRATRR